MKESVSGLSPVSYCEQFVSCHFSPVKADDMNKKMKSRANVQRRPNGGGSECVRLCTGEMITCWNQLVMNYVFQTDPQLQGFGDAVSSLRADVLFLISDFIALPQ